LPQVLILTFDEPPAQHEFLSKVAVAIEGLGATAQVRSAADLEKLFSWDDIVTSKGVRLIIANNSALQLHEELHKLQREGQGRQFLGECPLLPLTDVGSYLQDPALKRTLWDAIKEHLKAS
jgi:hypothetical protein